MPMLNIEDFQRKIFSLVRRENLLPLTKMPGCYAWTLQRIICRSVLCYSASVLSVDDEGSGIQASATAEFRCPLLVASACEVSNRKWMVRVGLARNWGNPRLLDPLQAWMEEGFSGLQHYLPGGWRVQGKFYPAQSPETLRMVFPVAIKKSRCHIFLGLP